LVDFGPGTCVIVVVVVVVRLLLVLVGRRRRRLGFHRGLVVVPVVGVRAAAAHERSGFLEVAAGVAERLAGVLLAQALELGDQDIARARRFGLGHLFLSASPARACGDLSGSGRAL
jgi:hypothetical protein